MESSSERGNSGAGPATQRSGNQPDPDIPATMAPTYPSPAPSSLFSFSAPNNPLRISENLDRKQTPNGAAKNAKDYYKQLYAITGKRKKHSNVDEGGRAKKRQAMDDGREDGTSPASAGLADITIQSSRFDDRDENEHMQLLKKEANPGDAQADKDLTQLYRSMVSFGHGKCKLVDQKWELDGFGTSLYHHQVIGVSWM